MCVRISAHFLTVLQKQISLKPTMTTIPQAYHVDVRMPALSKTTSRKLILETARVRSSGLLLSNLTKLSEKECAVIAGSITKTFVNRLACFELSPGRPF